MSEANEIVCFQCGHSIGSPEKLNYMPDGEPCKACADRLLELAPPIFHAPITPNSPVQPRTEKVLPGQVSSHSSGYEGDQPA